MKSTIQRAIYVIGVVIMTILLVTIPSAEICNTNADFVLITFVIMASLAIDLYCAVKLIKND